MGNYCASKTRTGTDLYPYTHKDLAAVRSYDSLFKLLLIGDSSVGKTSLVLQFTKGEFVDSYISTIGVDFKVKNINIHDKVVKLQIWDTAGQERYNTITSTYYRGAHGIIVVFDVTNRQSFEHVQKWLQDVEKFGEEEVMLVICGNKIDLPRNVSYEEAKQFADQHNIEYFECSAKTATNVEKPFIALAGKILSRECLENQ